MTDPILDAVNKLAKRTHMIQTSDISSPNLTIYFATPDDMNDAADALRNAFFASQPKET